MICPESGCFGDCRRWLFASIFFFSARNRRRRDANRRERSRHGRWPPFQAAGSRPWIERDRLWEPGLFLSANPRLPLMAGNHTIEPTESSFEQEVINRSAELPVILDFWAPWCGPCQQLAPILEKLAAEYTGRFVLAKINIDEQQGIAAAFQVQSIPTVVAIRDRQIVDAFQGALPEEAIRQWLQKLLPDPDDEEAQRLRALEQSDPQAAQAGYREILTHSPDHAEAKIGLARLALASNALEEAESWIEELQNRGFLEPEAERIQSEIHLRRGAAGTSGVEAAQSQAEANPDDVDAQLAYLDALAVSGQKQEALDYALSLLERNRGLFADAVRPTFLDILKTLSDEQTASDYRRRLATMLY